MSADIPLHVVFVEAWIKKGNEYLLARRSSKDDQSAGKWAVPGGKVELELETDIVENTLRREVKEEVGVEVDNFVFFKSKAFIRSSGHHVVSLSFTADYVSGEPEPLEDQDEVKWVPVSEMGNYFDSYWDDTLTALKAKTS